MNDNKLIIVESPNKIKALEGYLKALGYTNFTVLASYGHISNLLSKQNAIDVTDNFKMIWQETPQAAKALPNIIKAAKKADTLIIGTDPDREGEAIGWHIVRCLREKKIKLPVKRLLFHSITKQAISDAMKNLIDIRENLISAYLARLGLDFLVGFYISPILWRKLPGCLSAGRVQSAALRNIVELEYERVKFEPKQYYVIKADFKLDSNDLLQAKLVEAEGYNLERGCLYESSEDDLKKLLENINQPNYQLTNIQKKLKSKAPTAPFITSTLQQEASNKLSFSPSQTMKFAQKLYEGVKLKSTEQTGLITYMRTDNVNMDSSAIKSCRNWIEQNLGKEYLHTSVRIHKSKVRNAQEAHECIRPTNFSLTPEQAAQFLQADEAKLYELIWKKAIASQMSSMRYEETSIDIDNKKAVFRCTGSVLVFAGYRHFYTGKDDVILPAVEEGQKATLEQVDTASKETQPPARYTAASLIARMEALGIGRPSTYTKIVETLLNREYIIKQEGQLVPTQRSWFLIAFLKEFFKQYVEYEFTAQLEDELDDVSNDKRDWNTVLTNFWKDFNLKVEDAQKLTYEDIRSHIENMWHDLFFKAGEKCEKCGAKAQVRFWNGRGFTSCSKYPDCDWKRHILQTQETTAIGNDPETQQEIKQLDGQYGPYLEWEATDQHKAKRISLPVLLKNHEMNLELALKLKELPKTVGIHPETQDEIKVGFGRFGPYILYQKAFYPLKGNPLDITFDEVLSKLEIAKINKAKRQKKLDDKAKKN